ncbi:MAG: hypothetical protein JSW51_09460 [Gemmatimonadota bacterium]|nr:MAG: hypothetical protein JSW51_09460 [Gemmatimonadota bacterium]
MTTKGLFHHRQHHVVVAIALTLASACGGTTQTADEPAPDPRTRYQPFAASYEGVTHSRIEQTFNEQSDITEIGMRYHLSVEVTESDSGLHATLVIDSITHPIGPQVAAMGPQSDSARGATYGGIMLSNGALSSLTGGEDAGSLADELSSRLLSRFFPLIPDGGVELGAAWIDTIETSATLGGVDNAVRSIRQHEATEWTQYGGQPALLIVTESDYTFSGAGVQAGQAFTLEGQGRRHSRRYITADGRFIGFVSADTAVAEAHLTEAGIKIPVHQARTDTLTISP